MHEHAYHLPSRSSKDLEFPRTVRWERDYWLRRCLGYRVDADGKTLGRVPIVGSTAEVAGLVLTAERMAGRRHRIATVLVERVEHLKEPATVAAAAEQEDQP